MQNFLLSKYRNSDSLPLVGNITPSKGVGFSSAIYVLAAVAFAMSFYSYTAFDALKTATATISTTSGSNCKIISSFTASFGPQQKFPFIIGDPRILFSPGQTLLFYNQSYFSSYSDCVHAVASGFKVVSRNDGYGNYYMFIVASMSIGPFPSNTDAPYILSLLNKFLIPASLCEPFLNFPPYQCTDMVQLSYLSITSQSFAFASAIIGILFVVSTAFFNKYERQKPTNLADYADGHV